jgi:hypothetical protein
MERRHYSPGSQSKANWRPKRIYHERWEDIICCRARARAQIGIVFHSVADDRGDLKAWSSACAPVSMFQLLSSGERCNHVCQEFNP